MEELPEIDVEELRLQKACAFKAGSARNSRERGSALAVSDRARVAFVGTADGFVWSSVPALEEKSGNAAVGALPDVKREELGAPPDALLLSHDQSLLAVALESKVLVYRTQELVDGAGSGVPGGDPGADRGSHGDDPSAASGVALGKATSASP